MIVTIMWQLVTRAPAGCMCRPCTAVEVRTAALSSLHCQASHRHKEVISCVVLQDNSIMASELASFVDAGQLVNSYGPVRFT